MHNLIIKKIWNVIQFKRGTEAYFSKHVLNLLAKRNLRSLHILVYSTKE